MQTVIRLDVPEWQIGQPVTVYFKDTMQKRSICEANTGHWMSHKDEHQCSVCREITVVDRYVWLNDPFDYCPRCGARLEESERAE